MTEFHSPNFAFLADLDPPLMHQAALAERYCIDDPSSSLTKLRLFGELLAKNADTAEIRYSKGVRPEKGKNKAIAEWPTQRGPADYVLFNSLKVHNLNAKIS